MSFDIRKLTEQQMNRLMPLARYITWQDRFNKAIWGIFLGEIAFHLLVGSRLPWYVVPAAFGLLVVTKFIYEVRQSLSLWRAESRAEAVWSALTKEWIMVIVAVFLTLYRFGIGWAWWAMAGSYLAYYLKRRHDLKNLDRDE